jgi:acyl-CoA reductase-like NAD-dependent aldehyde dehydrogenase
MRAIIGERCIISEGYRGQESPANGEVIDTVPSLDLDQAREAIDVTYDSQEKLPAMGVAKRSRALL